MCDQGLLKLSSWDYHARDFPERVSEYWYAYLISQEHSKRETTYERDRLVAVSGLARRVGATLKTPYLAGLWQSSVVRGLHWYAVSSPTTKNNDAPSWSCASQQGGFNFTNTWNRGKHTLACSFVQADIGYVNPQDLFGGVTYGTLTLRGKLLSTTPEGTDYSLPRLRKTVSTPIWDDNRFDAAGICIMALPLSTAQSGKRVELLLLTMSASDSDRYVRVGAGTIYRKKMRRSHSLRDVLKHLPWTEVTLM